jgi:ATP-grasp domain
MSRPPPAGQVLLATWGSRRQAEELSSAYRRAGHVHLHVPAGGLTAATEAETVQGLARVSRSFARAHWVNLGRASRPGEVWRIAGAWQRDARQMPYPPQLFGPSPSAAEILDDKWATHVAVAAAGVATVPTYLTTLSRLFADDAPSPLVVKIRNGTGGAGVVAGDSAAACAILLRPLVASDEPVLACQFVDGLEMSVKVLVADEVLPVAVVVKERTRIPVVHGDWKVKVAVPLEPGSALHDVAARVAAATGARGFLSVEGVLDSATGGFVVSEVAGRRTGSFSIADAVSACGPAASAIPRLLGLGLDDVPPGRRTVALTVPLVDDQGARAAMAEALAAGTLLGADEEDLAALPRSLDTRRRLRLHLSGAPGEGPQRLLAEVARTFGKATREIALDLLWHARSVQSRPSVATRAATA